MKTLIIKPLGGLANRIRAIESARALSTKHHARLIIIWERNNILNARYEDCFGPIQGVRIINVSYFVSNIFSKAKRNVLHLTYLTIIKRLSDVQIDDDFLRSYPWNSQPTNPKEKFFNALASAHKTLYIQTCYEFYYPGDSFQVSIKKNIHEKACRTLGPNKHIIGIHVRRTDNKLAIEKSPLYLFINRMHELLHEFPKTKFYISTDCEDSFTCLKQLFSDKILYGACERRRDTTKGIESALIDLCCLSKTKLILGSSDSSFSEIASKMGKVQLEILIEEK